MAAYSQATIHVPGASLCSIESNSSDCDFACQEMQQGRGICIYNQCYCTDDVEFGRCEDDNHETCDALCQDMSADLVGFCMGDQCSCLSWAPFPNDILVFA
jgi:hypothetical protein